MNTILHQSASRGHANHGWLDTHHTFSFANYYNPERMHFGNLRVLNDDIIAGNMGFDLHPHDNMEIISIPIFGSIKHTDSMGHEQIIGPNEVQVMSAGSGLFHSEYNATSEPANFLQLWIYPLQKNVKPVYKQAKFNFNDHQGQWQTLVDSAGAPLSINQHARISRLVLPENEEISYDINSGSYGSYLFVIEGSIDISGITLNRRDGLGITQANSFAIKANQKSIVLNIEV